MQNIPWEGLNIYHKTLPGNVVALLQETEAKHRGGPWKWRRKMAIEGEDERKNIGEGESDFAW